eukprot:CAMPEP_0194278020 /NCGR_PEP_ID=MMETSP0169-20130528/10185_1 /TAXON_ID=218684 /ORGANISM="Corethron pennatum, Strain L29A3" /LENGTH=721 /DNA_ID=CAMNT_0039022125 /DNA_START=213 /DNA_END=2378 /DNA_ORIENTATION=+
MMKYAPLLSGFLASSYMMVVSSTKACVRINVGAGFAGWMRIKYSNEIKSDWSPIFHIGHTECMTMDNTQIDLPFTIEFEALFGTSTGCTPAEMIFVQNSQNYVFEAWGTTLDITCQQPSLSGVPLTLFDLQDFNISSLTIESLDTGGKHSLDLQYDIGHSINMMNLTLLDGDCESKYVGESDGTDVIELITNFQDGPEAISDSTHCSDTYTSLFDAQNSCTSDSKCNVLQAVDDLMGDGTKWRTCHNVTYMGDRNHKAQTDFFYLKGPKHIVKREKFSILSPPIDYTFKFIVEPTSALEERTHFSPIFLFSIYDNDVKENWSQYGGRIPLVAFRPESTKLVIVTSTLDDPNTAFNTENLPINQKNQIEISVIGTERKVKVNGDLVETKYVGPRTQLTDAHLYLGGNNEEGNFFADVIVSDVYFGPAGTGIVETKLKPVTFQDSETYSTSGTFSKNVQINTENFSKSVLVNSTLGGSKGVLSFCTKAEAILNDNTSVSFQKDKIKLSYDLTSNVFTVDNNSIKENDILTSTQEITTAYSIIACMCNDTSFLCDKDPAPLKQNGFAYICITPNSTDTEISNFDMRFEQDTNTIFTAVEGGKSGKFGMIVESGDTKKVVTRLITALFEYEKSSFNVVGNAILSFKSAQINRRLQQMKPTHLREVQDSSGGDESVEALYELDVILEKANMASEIQSTNIISITMSALGGFILLATVLVLFKKMKQ